MADDFEPSDAATVQPNRLFDEGIEKDLAERDSVLRTTVKVDSAHSRQVEAARKANTATLFRDGDQEAMQPSRKADYKKANEHIELSPTSYRRNSHRDKSDHNFRSKSGTESNQPTEHSGGYPRQNGVDALMKAYSSRTKFSGSFTEDFDGSVEEFETISQV